MKKSRHEYWILDPAVPVAGELRNFFSLRVESADRAAEIHARRTYGRRCKARRLSGCGPWLTGEFEACASDGPRGPPFRVIGPKPRPPPAKRKKPKPKPP